MACGALEGPLGASAAGWWSRWEVIGDVVDEATDGAGPKGHAIWYQKLVSNNYLAFYLLESHSHSIFIIST